MQLYTVERSHCDLLSTLAVVFPTRFFANPIAGFTRFLLLPQARVFSTNKPGYLEKPGIAIEFAPF